MGISFRKIMLYRTLYMNQSMFPWKHLIMKKLDLQRIRPESHRVKIKAQNVSSSREGTSPLSESKKSHVKASRLSKPFHMVFTITPSMGSLAKCNTGTWQSWLWALQCLSIFEQNAVSKKLCSWECSMLVWDTALGFSVSLIPEQNSSLADLHNSHPLERWTLQGWEREITSNTEIWLLKWT